MQKSAIILVLVLLLSIPDSRAQDGDVVTQLFAPPDGNRIELVPLVSGLNRPVFLTHAGDNAGRLFVIEQGGKILIIENGQLHTRPFLDVTSLMTWDVNAGGYTERGLLGLAFHPDYANNGQFFINYTDKDGATVVARYQVSDDPNFANSDSREVLLTIRQPFPNHNGGHMEFGPDGYLYISVGDGGSANDPLGSGQNPATLLGSILRIDVDNGTPYAIPEDNPFVNNPSGADEIWAYGLRNVWRFSFDKATGDLYLADVGQNMWEEVNFQPADSTGGENYGWNAYEASHVFAGGVDASTLVMPIAEYAHSEGCSITGGIVYRGERIGDLVGAYLYGDWCNGIIRYAFRDINATWQTGRYLDTGRQISSFGQDEAGEIYILDYQGTVLYLAQP